MKKYHSFLATALFLMFAFVSSAQILTPVKWEFASESLGNNEYNLIFTAKIDDGWTVYSQFTEDDGPVPTELIFENLNGAELLGKATEQGHKKEGMDKLFEVNVIKFLDDEDFVITQKVKASDNSKPISGYLTFMTCDNSRCLPPEDIDFSFDISKLASSGSGGADTKTSNASSSGSMSLENNSDQITTEEPPQETMSEEEAPTTIKIAKIGGADNAQEDQPAQSGMFKPVKWKMTSNKISDTEYDLVFKASIDKGWAVYSQYMEEGGPVPTTINYEINEGVELVGKAIESGKKKQGPDPLFDEIDEVIKFLGPDDFTITQKVKITDPKNAHLKGYLNFMTCDNKRCLNPTDIDFDYPFGSEVGKSSAPIGLGDDLTSVDQSRAPILKTYKEPLSDCGQTETKKSSLWWLFIGGMLGGFLALLTPCVFPMIPITVSFFTKDTKRKGWVNALIYGISIIVIYVILGLIITVTLGPAALQALSTNWIANVFFFLIFLFFAGSFFGYYEITLPSSWTTKSDQMADKGGLLGIFFMAATLALVSFSCTGPIVGTALVTAAQGGLMGPTAVMFGFSLALALPFTLFAAFPAWLNSLPKSGGWMNSVKVVLGFLEVGFAFKFLSTADLTQHWGLLKYEVFMAILIIVCILIAIYLFGFIKFPHDSPVKKLSLTRKIIASGFVLLALNLATGFTINEKTGIYNSLWLSGFSPPVMYNMFLEKGEVDPEIKKRFPSFSKCANNIDCFKDYYEGMTYAKEVGKPAFVDFTGHGCQNCRRTEDKIWVDDKVRSILNDDVVLISLYTDDREKLEKPFISAKDGKKKRNVGNMWSDFQVVNFAQNSQPLYIMMTPEEEVITHPRGYEEGVKGYQKYLNCGLDYFNSKQ